jgi:SAM-dependent MidA family methyltransferase
VIGNEVLDAMPVQLLARVRRRMARARGGLR